MKISMHQNWHAVYVQNKNNLNLGEIVNIQLVLTFLLYICLQIENMSQLWLGEWPQCRWDGAVDALNNIMPKKAKKVRAPDVTRMTSKKPAPELEDTHQGIFFSK